MISYSQEFLRNANIPEKPVKGFVTFDAENGNDNISPIKQEPKLKIKKQGIDPADDKTKGQPGQTQDVKLKKLNLNIKNEFSLPNNRISSTVRREVSSSLIENKTPVKIKVSNHVIKQILSERAKGITQTSDCDKESDELTSSEGDARGIPSEYIESILQPNQLPLDRTQNK